MTRLAIVLSLGLGLGLAGCSKDLKIGVKFAQPGDLGAGHAVMLDGVQIGEVADVAPSPDGSAEAWVAVKEKYRPALSKGSCWRVTAPHAGNSTVRIIEVRVMDSAAGQFESGEKIVGSADWGEWLECIGRGWVLELNTATDLATKQVKKISKKIEEELELQMEVWQLADDFKALQEPAFAGETPDTKALEERVAAAVTALNEKKFEEVAKGLEAELAKVKATLPKKK